MERISKMNLQAGVAFLLTVATFSVARRAGGTFFLTRDFQQDSDALPSADAG